MNFKQSLDRYLTTPPDDGFDGWAEQVINALSDEFYEANEYWCEENTPASQINLWLGKIFHKDIKPKEAAQLIERAYKIYKNGK